MRLSVTSEIAPLQCVMLHRPGAELEQLTPARLERMLFDDIPFLQGAQREHDVFASTLREQGIEVRYLVDLATETLSQGEALRRSFVDAWIDACDPAVQYYRGDLQRLLYDLPTPRDLVLKLMTGVTENELQKSGHHPLLAAVRGDNRFVIDPLPNLYFTRDPFAVIGHGVSLSRMFAGARRRETLFGQMIFRYHPDYAGQVPAYYQPDLPFSIEGGDILNLGGGALAVGLSQRTSPEALELLAERLFSDPDSGIDRILALDIPNIRAYMHLDTVFTQVDVDAFTVHPGILKVVRAFLLRKSAGGMTVETLDASLEHVLEAVMHLDAVRLIQCGGNDAIAAQREQWNDGSNTLCIAPGVVVVYDRNTVTNELLRANHLKTIEIPSSELARGRGGPRCMTMPFVRSNG